MTDSALLKESDQEQGDSPRWVAALWVLVVGVAAALVARIAWGGPAIGQDQAWLLYAAERMLHGIPLYGRELTETNPPLIIWLSALPVGVGRVLGLSIPSAFYLTVAGTMLGSTVWCYRLMAGGEERWSRTQRVVFAAGIFFVVSRPELAALGQREHLLVLLVLPFLVAFGVERRVPLSRAQAVGVALAAATGVCLKPQQVILLLSFQLAVAWRERIWRNLRGSFGLSCLVTLAVYACYGAAVLVFAPLYVRSEMKVLVETYWAFGMYSIPQLIFLDHHFLAYLLLGGGLFAYARQRGVRVRFAGYLLLASVAASVAFDLQHTGFMYQHIPQDLLAELAIVWLAVQLVGERFPKLYAVIAMPRAPWAAYAACALVFAGLTLEKHNRVQASATAQQAATLSGLYVSLPADTPVLSLSTNPQALFPFVLQNRLVLASRFVHLWMLPAVQQNEWYREGGPKPRRVLDAKTVTRLGALQRSQIVDDLVTRRPMYVVVPRCRAAFSCEAIGQPDFDMLAWFERDASFSAVWVRYRHFAVLDAPEHGLVYDGYVLDRTGEKTRLEAPKP